MGHVRVYTISDTMARFYSMNDMNVIHPMGWDSFGLPAENAAIQRKIPADEWTVQNIEHMRKQLQQLGCAFDWDREFATCDPGYYRWTQKLFLMLFNDGLAYQKNALVNWDPVDKTVLADEQVDANGCSWRSGAKVEKKLLKQWFIRTTKFAKPMYEGLDNPILEDWKDIIKIQQHWIGETDGYSFTFNLVNSNESLTVWTANPEDLNQAIFIALSKDHVLAGEKNLQVYNPITDTKIPIIVTDEVSFPLKCDTYLGVANNETDIDTAKIYNLNIDEGKFKTKLTKDQIIKAAEKLDIGGFPVSSKLKDWLISRQRFWGTPIPITHCKNCGTVPVPDKDLPVVLPQVNKKEEVGTPLSGHSDWIKTKCPKCGDHDARRETDTMDTFVDSSWYFLRFLDPHNQNQIFDPALTTKFMPVDLYVGGKEHAVLHLYYARFFNHYLFSKGLVPHPEPFKRLLVQGMVMGQSFRLKGSGKYIPESEVEYLDKNKTKAVEKSSSTPLVLAWEKMSKSKFNGVDPADVINEHGCDSIRLIMLADVAPTSSRNWSAATFPGILLWQNRIWMTVNEFLKLRQENTPVQDLKALEDEELRLLDARNFYIAGTTFNYRHTHQLSVAISKMQGLTNAIRVS